jgi:pimeloyl-ACP methyl ester carboxylesterase
MVAGFDWGARTADIVAALWPERCTGLVTVSGYMIGSQESGSLSLLPDAELQRWYRACRCEILSGEQSTSGPTVGRWR